MEKKIYQIVRDCAPGTEIGEINLSTRLLDDLEYDSLSIMELFAEIEDAFGINCMEYEDAYNCLVDVESLLNFVENKLSKNI